MNNQPTLFGQPQTHYLTHYDTGIVCFAGSYSECMERKRLFLNRDKQSIEQAMWINKNKKRHYVFYPDQEILGTGEFNIYEYAEVRSRELALGLDSQDLHKLYSVCNPV